MLIEVAIGLVILAVVNRLIYKWLMLYRDFYGR